MANPKILVVDDDPDIVETTKIVLEANGYEVATAQSGQECLSKLKDVNPDLIILDVMMNSLTEGLQVTYQLRSPNADPQYAKVPILMITGIAKETQVHLQPKEAGDYLPVDDFVEKPIQSTVLLEKVKKLLAK